MSKAKSGRLVLITGAAGGIGQALVERFSGAGDRVVAHDLDRDALDELAARHPAGRVLPIVSQLPDSGALQAALQPVVAEHGPISAVVVNAGASRAGSLARTSEEDWRRDLDLNLTGGYITVQAVIEDLKATRGSIVMIGSVNGLQAIGDPAYSAAKAGLTSYTMSLAVEYGRYGVRANIVCPGTVNTPIWSQRVAQEPMILESLRKWYPLGDVVQPEDVAEAVWFLASPAARMITGVVLPVDAGLMAGNRLLARDLTLEDF